MEAQLKIDDSVLIQKLEEVVDAQRLILKLLSARIEVSSSKYNHDDIDRMLRIRAVCEATGLSRSTIYKKISDGDFPTPTRLSERAIGWKRSVIEEWLRLSG